MKIKILMLIFGFNILYSQSGNKELDKILNSAYYYKLNKDMPKAIEKMSEAISKFPTNDIAYITTSNWYSDIKEYDKSLDLLYKCETNISKLNPVVYKYIAENNFKKNKYNEAIVYANKFLKVPNLSEQNYAYCNKIIKNSEYAISQKISTDIKQINFEKMDLNINSNLHEYFPSLSADEKFLYFTRNTNGNEDIWVSEYKNEQWNKAMPIDQVKENEDGSFSSINTYSNDGAHTISANGKYLFFTSCDRPKNFGKCDLYFAAKNGNSWGVPKMLPFNVNSRGWESQPCVSNDGKKIFFARANDKNGYGGIDILMSEISEKGEFSDPINLGSTINTSGNEDKPFIHPDGKTLYFVSDGHPGFGGKDIFMSRLENDEWQKPINLGNSINSKNEEMSIFVNALGTKGYISRDNVNDEHPNLDIYSFDLPQDIKPKQVTYIKGTIIDAKSKDPIRATINIFDQSKDSNVMKISSDNQNGQFLVALPYDVNYGFVVFKESYSLFSQSYEFKNNNDNKPIELLIKLFPLESGVIFELKNVFFETAKFDLMEASKQELGVLVTLLSKNPNLKIKIKGHTDNVGNELKNKTLSDNRAKSVYNFLVSSGISSERLKYQGYGSTIPKEDNSTEEGRAKNRRTEIEIL